MQIHQFIDVRTNIAMFALLFMKGTIHCDRTSQQFNKHMESIVGNWGDMKHYVRIVEKIV